MSAYNNDGAQGQHVGIGTKIKDAVTPGTHNTGDYVNPPQQGGLGSGGNTGGLGGHNTGNTGGNTGLSGGHNTSGYGQQQQQGFNGGSNNQQGYTAGNQQGGGLTGHHHDHHHNTGGLGGSGVGGGAGGGAGEHYEKKTHSTNDHSENETFETSTRN